MKLLAVLLLMVFPLAAATAADVQPTGAQIDTAFAVADADKNGTVSLQEAKKFGITTTMFQKANPDKDGSLDKKEFVAALLPVHSGKPRQRWGPRLEGSPEGRHKEQESIRRLRS